MKPLIGFLDVSRSSSEAPQEAIMLQLKEELTYMHQAYILCHTMQDTLAASLVWHASQQPITFASDQCKLCW